jgi:hypothetical protein
MPISKALSFAESPAWWYLLQMIARSGSTPTGDGPAGNEGARTLEAMLPFHELFPEIGLSETRSAAAARLIEVDKVNNYAYNCLSR